VAKKSASALDSAAPPDSGASAPDSVDASLAAKAQAEVDAARAAPRDTSSPMQAPRKRGRPPGSGTKKPEAIEGEVIELATPEQFASLVDVANMVFRSAMVAPIPDDEKKEWAAQAAVVANRWGGQLPLMPELTLIGTTCMIFGPRVVTMLSKDHKAKVAAEKKKLEEQAHNDRVAAEAKRDEKRAA
jgi:hypothetical protein